MAEANQTDADRLDKVAEHFAGTEVFPWVVAAGAISQMNKYVSGIAGRVLGEFDLTMPRFEVLALLDQRGGTMSVLELKQATLIHPPTMTYTLDWLEERDLVSREHDRVDRRSIIVHITDQGRHKTQAAHDALCMEKYGLPWVEAADAERAADALKHLLRTRPRD